MGPQATSTDSVINLAGSWRDRRPRHSRVRIGLGVLLAVFVSMLRASDPPQEAPSDLSCVEDIEIPRYTFIARRSPQGGMVAATVTVGTSGKAASVETTASDANLAEEVRLFLERYTVYSTGCEGRRLQIRFTFELKGKAQSHPPLSVHFRPPNHFVLVSRPMNPEVN